MHLLYIVVEVRNENSQLLADIGHVKSGTFVSHARFIWILDRDLSSCLTDSGL